MQLPLSYFIFIQNKVDPAIIAKQAVMCGLKLMENEYVKIPINTNNSEQRRYIKFSDT